MCVLPFPLHDYSGLLAAPLAEAEELVSRTPRLAKQLIAASLEVSVALQ